MSLLIVLAAIGAAVVAVGAAGRVRVGVRPRRSPAGRRMWEKAARLGRLGTRRAARPARHRASSPPASAATCRAPMPPATSLRSTRRPASATRPGPERTRGREARDGMVVAAQRPPPPCATLAPHGANTWTTTASQASSTPHGCRYPTVRMSRSPAPIRCSRRRFPVGEAAAVALSCAGRRRSELWRIRSGRTAVRAPSTCAPPLRHSMSFALMRAGRRTATATRRPPRTRSSRCTSAPTAAGSTSTARSPACATATLDVLGCGRLPGRDRGGGEDVARTGSRGRARGRRHVRRDGAHGRRVGGAPARAGARRSPRRRDREDRRRPTGARCPTAIGRSPASARSTSRASSPARPAGARSPSTAPT